MRKHARTLDGMIIEMRERNEKQMSLELPSPLHRFEFIDTFLRIALSNHFQCFVFVSARGDILLMQTIIISDFGGILNRAQFIFQSLERESR